LPLLLRARSLLEVLISLSVRPLPIHARLLIVGIRLPVHRRIAYHLAARSLLGLAPETMERVWTLVWVASRRPLGVVVVPPSVVWVVPRFLLIIGALLILEKWRVIGRLFLLVERLLGEILLRLLLLLVSKTALFTEAWVTSGFNCLLVWLTQEHLTEVVTLPLDVNGLILRERMKVNGEHRLRVELVAEVFLNILKLLFVRRLCLVRDWLDRFLSLLHDVLVLKTLDVALLALHVRVEKSTSLPTVRTGCLP
jgi:hypothetical protein